MPKKAIAAIVLALLFGVAAPVGAETVRESFDYGYFYGTFGEDPNILLLAGGMAEDFCRDNPDDPFGGSPGTTHARTKVRKDGSVRVKVDAGRQPIHLYEIPQSDDGPSWITRVCNDGPIPEPFASGKAKLTVRDTYLFEDGPPVRLFNSVKGKAIGTDGTKYQVRASADIPFVDGAPVGSPPDWVSFSLRALG